MPNFSYEPWFDYAPNNASDFAGDQGGSYPGGFVPEFYTELAETMTALSLVPENHSKLEIQFVTAREGYSCRTSGQECYGEIMMRVNAELVGLPAEDSVHYSGLKWTASDGSHSAGSRVDIAWTMVDSYLNGSGGFVVGVGDDLEFTSPMTEDIFSGFVLTEREPMSIWRVWYPFSAGLWAAIGLSTVFGGVVLVLLARISSDEEITARSFVEAWYYSWAAVLDGDEYTLYNASPLGRVYRLGLLALVLVVGATYTANLAAFLTAPNVKVYGPRDLSELKETTACYSWSSLEGSETMAEFVKSIVLIPRNEDGSAAIHPLDFAGIREWQLRNLKDGVCDIVIDGIVAVLKQVKENCGVFSHVSDIQFGPTPMWNMMRRNTAFEVELARNVTKATRVLRGGEAYSSIMRETMGIGGQGCPASTESNTAQIGVRDMGGILLVYAGLGVVSLIGAGWWRWGTQQGAEELMEVNRRKLYVPARDEMVAGKASFEEAASAENADTAGVGSSGAVHVNTGELVRQMWVAQGKMMQEMGIDAQAVMRSVYESGDGGLQRGGGLRRRGGGGAKSGLPPAVIGLEGGEEVRSRFSFVVSPLYSPFGSSSSAKSGPSEKAPGGAERH